MSRQQAQSLNIMLSASTRTPGPAASPKYPMSITTSIPAPKSKQCRSRLAPRLKSSYRNIV